MAFIDAYYCELRRMEVISEPWPVFDIECRHRMAIAFRQTLENL
jgi:hypothetical protein